jgi:hypothetical protein
MVPLALTIGEPSGIGPDILLLAWLGRTEQSLPPFYVLGDPALIAARARRLNLDVPLIEVTPDQAAARFASALPVMPLENRLAAGLAPARRPENRWTPDNPSDKHPRTWNRSDEYWAAQANTYFLESTDYIRLKTLEVPVPRCSSGLPMFILPRGPRENRDRGGWALI